MSNPEYERLYLEAALPQLKEYLLSHALYWTLQDASPLGTPSFPTLTPGWLMLMKTRAEGRNLSPHLSRELDRQTATLDDLRREWQVAWKTKVEREFEARIGLWFHFVREYRESPENNADRYSYEVNRRVILQLLVDELGEMGEEERKQMESADAWLRAVFVPGDFIWDQAYQRAFPKDTYWYLYGTLKD
jgi:hypothetical protein